jgi:hypothetical protein
MPIPSASPRPQAVAWVPVVAIVVCLALSAASAWLGHRQLVRAADVRLAAAGEFVARRIEAEFRSRLRVLEYAALFDARQADPVRRDAERRAVVERLALLYPELVWAGFAVRPGRVEVATPGVLAGADVSMRDWWTAALRGPFLGGPHPGRNPVSAPVAADRQATQPAVVEPPRLLDIAVPLRDEAGASYGVLAAHLDAAWLETLRRDLRQADAPASRVEVVLVDRGGRVVSGAQTVELAVDPARDAARGTVAGTLDGQPRMFGGQTVEGDVAVTRLGWSLYVAEDPDAHFGPARRFAAQVLAVGALAAVCLAALLAWLLRPRPAP